MAELIALRGKMQNKRGTRAKTPRVYGRNIYDISCELGNALGEFIEVRERADVAVSRIESLIDDLAPYIEVGENRRLAAK